MPPENNETLDDYIERMYKKNINWCFIKGCNLNPATSRPNSSYFPRYGVCACCFSRMTREEKGVIYRLPKIKQYHKEQFYRFGKKYLENNGIDQKIKNKIKRQREIQGY